MLFSSSKSWFALQIAKIQNGLLVLLWKPSGLAGLGLLVQSRLFSAQVCKDINLRVKEADEPLFKKINPLL